jgi:hemerythrin
LVDNAADPPAAKTVGNSACISPQAALDRIFCKAQNMALIEWNDALAIGIPEIDYQHRNLVSMLNALHEAVESGETREALGEILEELDLYVINHFATEERLMERIKYEFVKEHKAEHLRLASTVQDFRNRFASNEASADEMLQFLIRWLLNHIAGVDSHIADEIKRGTAVSSDAT